MILINRRDKTCDTSVQSIIGVQKYYPDNGQRDDTMSKIEIVLTKQGKTFKDYRVDILLQIVEKEKCVYDKAKWHYDGVFPRELDRIPAYVPTGMFITRLVKNDLVYTAVDFQVVLASELPTIYHIEDSLENYRMIEAVITERYEGWRCHGKIK